MVPNELWTLLLFFFTFSTCRKFENEADHLSNQHILKCMEIYSCETVRGRFSSCLSFVQVDCFSRAALCVRLDSLLSGPDGLCRSGNQRDMSSSGGTERGKEARGH